MGPAGALAWRWSAFGGARVLMLALAEQLQRRQSSAGKSGRLPHGFCQPPTPKQD